MSGPQRDFPLPDQGTDPGGFMRSLRAVKVWAGNPSLAELRRQTGVPASTLFDALRLQHRLPSLEIVRAVVRACGADQEEIRRWEQAWRKLSARPDVAGPPAADDPRDGPGWVPRQLPPDVAGFTGRRQALDALRATPPAAPATVITGTAGVGKTALAVHWANGVAVRFPDGQLYLDLRGHSGDPAITAAEALPLLLQSLGVPAERIPADLVLQTGLYRSVLAGRRVLVVLDNVIDAAHVRPMLPGGAGCHVLITSRNTLAGLVVREGAFHVALTTMHPDESVALLTTHIGAARTTAEPVAVAELAELCAHLPLALRIAAANLAIRPGRSVAAAVAELQGTERLGRLRVEGDSSSAVSAALEASYRALPGESQRLFRLLGLIPGPEASREAAAVLMGRSLDDPMPEIDELLAAHLLAEPAPDRFRGHDLLALYARRLAAVEPEPARGEALRRLLSWYMLSSGAAMVTLYPHRTPGGWGDLVTVSPPHHFDSPAEAREWLVTELANLTAAAVHAADHGPGSFACNMAKNLNSFLFARGAGRMLVTVAQAGLRAAEATDDAVGRGHSHMALAMARVSLGQLQSAIGEFRAAAEHFQVVGLMHNVRAARGALGDVYIRSGDITRAAELLKQRLDETSPLEADKFTLVNLCTTSRIRGEYADALRCGSASRALAVDAGLPSLVATADIALAHVHLALGDFAAAEPLLLTAHAGAGNVDGEIDVYDAFAGLVLVCARTGRHEEAASWAAALERLLERGVTSGSGDDWAHAAIVEAHLAAGRPQLAAAVGFPAVDRHERIGHRLAVMRLRVLLGQAQSALGDPAAARELWETAMAYAVEQQLPDRALIEEFLTAAGARS